MFILSAARNQHRQTADPLYNLGMRGLGSLFGFWLLLLWLPVLTGCQQQPPEFETWPLPDFQLPAGAKVASLPDWLKPYSTDGRFVTPQSSKQRWWAVSFIYEGELKTAQQYFHQLLIADGYKREYGDIYIMGLGNAPLPDQEEVDQIAGYTRNEYESIVVYDLLKSPAVKPGENKHQIVFYIFYYGERPIGSRGSSRRSGGDLL